jgi:hypothetical protein
LFGPGLAGKASAETPSPFPRGIGSGRRKNNDERLSRLRVTMGGSHDRQFDPARWRRLISLRGQQLHVWPRRSGHELQCRQCEGPDGAGSRHHVREHDRLQSVRAASLGWRSRPLRGLRQSVRPRARCRHLGPQRRDAAGPIPQQQSCRMGLARQRREPGLGRRGAAGQQYPAAAVGFRLHHLRGRFLDGDADHRSDGRHKGGKRRSASRSLPAPPIVRAPESSPEPS